MKKIKLRHIILPILAILLLLLSIMFIGDTTVTSVNAETTEIILDLRYGNIRIDQDQYTYYDSTKTKQTGTHVDGNYYHIIQTNEDGTAASDINWNEVTADVTDVVNYAKQWDASARNVGRTPTANNVIISSEGVPQTVILDNIWSTHQNGSTGGVNVQDMNTLNNTHITLKLKGDNRLGYLYYYNNNAKNSSLTFTSVEGDGSKSGSLTVIGNQTPLKSNGRYRTKLEDGTYVDNKVPYNHWNSVLGGTDGYDAVYKLFFNGGTVYAGATMYENCTAIGGGGNGMGQVTINGGKVTAVTASTGAAIGGGIAHTSLGGTSDITINGGEVYAYNLGQPYSETISSDYIYEVSDFDPGSAIGGGSSVNNIGNLGKVKINGGYVYAESIGGSGIGGGNTIKNTGGKAEVTITGGDVLSRSMSKDFSIKRADGVTRNFTIESGAGIGGGSSTNFAGGSATVKISGGYVDSNGIGGGTSTKAAGGSADVTITGGTISATTIGGGFSNTYGYADGTVTVTGGSVNTRMAAIPTNGSEMIYLTRVTLYDDDFNKATNKYVKTLHGNNLGNYSTFANGNPQAIGLNDVKSDSEGMLYFFLPEGTSIDGATSLDGTIEYIASEELDGRVDVRDTGILKNTGTLYHSLVNITYSDFYDLYTDENAFYPMSSTVYVERNSKLKFYVQASKNENGDYCTLTPYIAVTDSKGNKSFQPTYMSTPVNGLSYMDMTITTDTQIFFKVDDGTREYFTIDLTSGDVKITKDIINNALTIEQNGYVLNGYTGDIYLTSGGYPTSNQFIVDCDDKEVSVLIDKVVVSSPDSPIQVDSGTLNITTSESDDYIISTGSSAISIAENATVNIDIEGVESLKLIGAAGDSAIKGEGTINITDDGGFLILNKGDNSGIVPQISVGVYNYNSTISGKLPYTASLYDGNFEFELIGYVKDDVLYDVDVMSSTNRENFAARGVYKIYSDKVTDNQITSGGNVTIEDGNYVLTLDTTDDSQLQHFDVKIDGVSLKQGQDYTFTDNKLIIYGKSFTGGNIVIEAVAYGQIGLNSYDYEDVFDNSYHSIELVIANASNYTIYYSTEQELTIDNYLEKGSTTNPKFKDTINQTVYWFVIDNKKQYSPKNGSNKVIITKGTNEWEGRLSCTDVVYDATNPNVPEPSISSKWGTVKYVYYESDQTTIIDDVSFLPVGTYYVRAYVETEFGIYGNINYDYMITDYYIRFNVFETSIFTESFKSYDKANDAKTRVDVPFNGAFTEYYQFISTNNMKIGFTTDTVNPLNVGTEIIMISYPTDGSVVASYYYYVVKESDINGNNIFIELSNFVSMGDKSTNYSYPIDTAVNLQFALEFGQDYNNGSELSVRIVDNNNVNITDVVAIGKTRREYCTITNTTPTVQPGFISIPFHVVAYGVGTKLVSYEINNAEGNFKLDEISVMLSNGYISTFPTAVYGNHVIFMYDTTDITGLDGYLLIDNLPAGIYNVKADVRILANEEDHLYPLGNQNIENHVEVNNIVVTEYIKPILQITDVRGDRLVNGYLELTVFLNSSLQIDNSLTVTLYEKTANGYIASNYGVAYTLNETNESVLVTARALHSGTYRLVFAIGNATCYYNFIVD